MDPSIRLSLPRSIKSKIKDPFLSSSSKQEISTNSPNLLGTIPIWKGHTISPKNTNQLIELQRLMELWILIQSLWWLTLLEEVLILTCWIPTSRKKEDCMSSMHFYHMMSQRRFRSRVEQLANLTLAPMIVSSMKIAFNNLTWPLLTSLMMPNQKRSIAFFSRQEKRKSIISPSLPLDFCKNQIKSMKT